MDVELPRFIRSEAGTLESIRDRPEGDIMDSGCTGACGDSKDPTQMQSGVGNKSPGLAIPKAERAGPDLARLWRSSAGSGPTRSETGKKGPKRDTP